MIIYDNLDYYNYNYLPNCGKDLAIECIQDDLLNDTKIVKVYKPFEIEIIVRLFNQQKLAKDFNIKSNRRLIMSIAGTNSNAMVFGKTRQYISL